MDKIPSNIPFKKLVNKLRNLGLMINKTIATTKPIKIPYVTKLPKKEKMAVFPQICPGELNPAILL